MYLECTFYVIRPEQFAESEALPKKTQKSKQWALWVLTLSASEWITECNKHCSEKCPRDVLEMEDTEKLAKWLSLFTFELLRKKDSSKYPPATDFEWFKGLEITIVMELANSALQC